MYYSSGISDMRPASERRRGLDAGPRKADDPILLGAGYLRCGLAAREKWAMVDVICQLPPSDANGLGVAIDKTFQRRQRLLAQVVLKALCVGLRGPLRDADGLQELEDGLVAAAGLLGERAAAGGEEDGAVGAGGDEALALEAGDGADDGDVGDAQGLGDVGDAGFAGRVDEVGDDLGVILGELQGVGGPGGPVWSRAEREVV